MESFEISRAGIYSKYPEETLLFPVYTTRQIKTVILIFLKFNDRDSNHPFLAIVFGDCFRPPCFTSLLNIIICRFLFASRAVFFLPSSLLIIYISVRSSLNEPAVILGKVMHWIASTSHKVCVRSCTALDFFVVLRP